MTAKDSNKTTARTTSEEPKMSQIHPLNKDDYATTIPPKNRRKSLGRPLNYHVTLDVTRPSTHHHHVSLFPDASESEPSRTILSVPQAHMWEEGMIFADSTGKDRLEVAYEGDMGVGKTYGDANCIAVIAQPSPNDIKGENSRVVAVVRSKNGCSGSAYEILTCFPAYVGQKAEPDSCRIPHSYCTRKHYERPALYLYGKLKQGPFGRAYNFKRCTENGKKELILRATNTFICLSFFACALPFLCAKWHVHFYQKDQQHHRSEDDEALIIRDQRERTVTVAAGENLVLATCLAYAFDRLTNICSSSSERQMLTGAVMGGAATGILVGALI